MSLKMNGWSGISSITLFAEDLFAARAFYEDILGLSIQYEDQDSVVFRLGNTLINVLLESAVPELISPARLAPHAAGSRVVMTLTVEDIDATCAVLTATGASLLNGPVDRPWGIRTAGVMDPNGCIWEIAH
jgi:lactoylglutathione lyase